ncbi:DNA-binding WRKY transcription factor, partial [Tanacetum coccineum]
TNAVLARSQGTSVKRSALWRDVKTRVIMKASHTSAANNNTLAQVPSSPHGERVCIADELSSFNNSSRKRSFQHILPVAHAQNIDANRSVRRRHIVDHTSISVAEHCQSDSACDEGPSTSQPSSSNAEHRQSDFALDEGTSVKRSALWRDIRARVITKASHTSAANNNTLAQGPTSPHGERVISFNNISRKRSFQHIFPAAHAQNIDANRSVRRRHIVDRTSISAAEHCQSDSACDEGLSTCEPSFSNSAFDEVISVVHPAASSDPEALQTRLRSMIAPSESSEEVAVSRSNEIESEVISIPPDSKRQKKESAGVNDIVATKANYEPRVVVATTSPVDIVNDGYSWRKYGQKLVKGNPNPRSYYKCAYACCSVRKHVERASHDEKVVVTTYEGRLDHEMPSGIRTGTINTQGNKNGITSHVEKAVVTTYKCRHDHETPSGIRTVTVNTQGNNNGTTSSDDDEPRPQPKVNKSTGRVPHKPVAENHLLVRPKGSTVFSWPYRLFPVHPEKFQGLNPGLFRYLQAALPLGMSQYFQPRNAKLLQVEGVNPPDEKIELEEKVDDLEHRIQEVPLDKSQTLNLEEVKCLEAEKIKLADRTPEICSCKLNEKCPDVDPDPVCLLALLRFPFAQGQFFFAAPCP